MSAERKIEDIFQFVRQYGYNVPRDYQTMGGMWTVDSYEHLDLPGLRVQLMDEGYTHAIVTEDLHVYAMYSRSPVFSKGGEEQLDKILQEIEKCL